MSGLFTVTVAEASGFVAIPTDLDRLAVVMGYSSAGSGLSAFYLSGSSAVTGVGYGDAVDTLCQIIEQRQSGGGSGQKFPAALYTVPGTTAGSYGTIDNSGVTGTALFAVDSAVHPHGTYEARFLVVNGGTVGVTGITFKWSLDGGRTYSNLVALGTADNYTIPNSNTKFVLTPSSADLTALNTLINEEFTDLNAHVILTAGTVHSSADNADVVSAGTYPSATSTATRVARVNALKAAYNLHRVKGTGASIHINAPGDTVNTLATADATDDETALTLALALKVALNAHEASTVFHTIADASNNVTSAAPAVGTLIAGDVGKVRTLAPQPSTADVDAAFTALALAPGDFALLVCEFPCNAAMLAHVTTGLNTLRDIAGKRVTALVRTSIPDAETAQTDAAWNILVAADAATFSDSRIIDRAAYGFVTDAMTTQQYLRSTLAQFAADVVRVDRFEWPACPADQAEANVILSDSTGALIGHDEGPRGASTGLSNDALGNRFSCEQRVPDPLRREAVFNCVPWTLYGSTDTIRNLMTRRVANAMERTAVSAGLSTLGGVIFYTPADPAVPGSRPTLTDASRNAVHGVIFNALSQAFADDIQNADDGDVDAGLVQVAPIVTVSGGNLISISLTLAPLVLGYLLSLSITLAVRE